MKKAPVIIVACLFITTAISFGLWLHEKSSQTDLLLMCQHGVNSSLQAFKEYRITGKESCYTYAVADFNVFLKASFLMNDNTLQRRNITFSNEVYGVLVISPEQAKKHIDEIVEVLTILSTDINNPNGYVQMSNLRNSIKE